jgi:hypothetical protein
MKRVSILNFIRCYLYPQGRKDPNGLIHFLFIKVLVATLFVISIILSSCKTCKCPAYSEKSLEIYEQKV